MPKWACLLSCLWVDDYISRRCFILLVFVMERSSRPSLGSGARLFVELSDGEYEYLGPQLCGSIYEFLWTRYCLSAYELRLRACEGGLASLDFAQLRCE